MFSRFLLVGGFGFCIDAGITYLLIQLTIAPWIARVPAITLAMIFTWLVNRYFTYKVDKPRSTNEALRYTIVAATMATINYLIYCALVSYGIQPLIAVTLATAFQTIVSFNAYRYFVFSEHTTQMPTPFVGVGAVTTQHPTLNTGKRTFSDNTTAILICIGISVSLSILFLNLNIFAASLPTQHIDHSIRLAFEQNELTDKDRLDGDFIRGADQYNDCLILQMALLRSNETIKDALSPLMVPKNHKKNSKIAVCEALHNTLEKNNYEYERYHRYLHGHRTVAAILLNLTDLTTSRLILKLSIYGLIFLIFASGVYQLIGTKLKSYNDGGSIDNIMQGGAQIIISLGIFGFYGLAYFGQSFTHGPFAILILLFILISFQLNPIECTRTKLYALTAIFGSLAMYFEFLSGPLPLSCAIILGVMSIFWSKKDHIDNIGRTISALLVFIFSALICYVFKISVTNYIFDDAVFSEVKNGLLLRTGSASGYNASVSYTLIDGINQLRWNLGSIAWNSDKMGYLIIGFCFFQLLTTSLFVFKRIFSINFKLRIFTLLSSVLGILAWYALFLNHTVEHAWFMVRLLTWPIIAGWLAWWLILIELLRIKAVPLHKPTNSG